MALVELLRQRAHMFIIQPARVIRTFQKKACMTENAVRCPSASVTKYFAIISAWQCMLRQLCHGKKFWPGVT